MRHLKYLLILLLTVISCYSMDNKKLISEAKKNIHEGIVQWDESKFFKASGLCERVLSTEENEFALYYQSLAYANILQKAMVEKNKEKFDQFFESTLEKLSQLKQNQKWISEAEALTAHIFMSKLNVYPNDAPSLSGKIHSSLGKALALNPKNPRALVIKATMLFYTPKMFGGDTAKAIEIFENTKNLFDKKPENSLMPEWGALDLYATLGMAYTKTGKLLKAKELYKTALTKEPNYGRIKYSLLPQLEKEIQKGN